jgi:hypothetical protein
MNKKLIIPALLLLTIIGCVIFLLTQEPQRAFDGRITLDKNHKSPYGTWVAHALLQKHFESTPIIVNNAAPDSYNSNIPDTGVSLIVVIDKYFEPTMFELDTLVQLAYNGSHIFINSMDMNDVAKEFFKVKARSYYEQGFVFPETYNGVSIDDSFYVTLDSNNFTTPLKYGFLGAAYANSFSEWDKKYIYPLGFNKNGKPNLLAYKVGSGSIYLMSTPVTFTNFFLLHGNNHQYFKKLLTLVPETVDHVVWDEYFINKAVVENKPDSDGILSVLMRQEAFRWAIYLALAGFLFYLLTGIKRRQQVIKPHQKPKNERLEFVTTIGKLYFDKGDHKNLTDKLSYQWFDYVRTHYKISTQVVDANFIQKLAAKSGIPENEITDLVITYKKIQEHTVIAPQLLMHYHEQLTTFYQKSI